MLRILWTLLEYLQTASSKSNIIVTKAANTCIAETVVPDVLMLSLTNIIKLVLFSLVVEHVFDIVVVVVIG